MNRLALVLLVLAAALPAPALATPVATNFTQYSALGRVFPDPLAGCQRLATSPCSPNAQGYVPATQFLQYGEFVDALKFMNTTPGWQRYLEVLVLDGKIGDGSGTAAGESMFPGNNLSFLEWAPKPEYVSAGVPTTTLDRKKSDLIVVRVTDETVPDAGKKRMTLSLSIHGIERAGVEGGTRAMEDLVTAATAGRTASPIVADAVKTKAPTFADVLRRTIIYFTYPNPDGWRRGSVSEGGVFFQRYNGNGVDPNRDWPDIGYSFRPYSGGSEPETRAFLAFYRGVQTTTKSRFSAGDDLHGQPFADALSYTLLPHGRHDFGKDFRLREAAKTINRAQYEATKWSPIIQPNSAPTGGGTVPCSPSTTVGTACSKIYAQTWGSVYDTINYTTTGTLGDWFDSSLGLGADGIDNEMSFSHLDRNIVFDPHGEQLHVDGNRAIIFGHLAELLNPPSATFDAPGAKGYVPNVRLTRAEQVIQEDASKKTVPQLDYIGLQGTADPAEDGQTVIPFTVYKRKHTGKELGIYNGGMRVDVTTTNVDGISSGVVAVKLQCRYCDHHVGTEEDDGWTTVADDFNQSNIYAQAGVTVAVNRPEASPGGTQWRAVISLGSAITRMDVHFTSGPATTDGATEGDLPPVLRGYDVANTDFFPDLNRFITDPAKRFQTVDPRAVISGQQSLAGFDTIVLADAALPGYTGLYRGEPTRPSGPPTADILIEDTKPTAPGQTPTSCARTEATSDHHDFTIGPNDGDAALTAGIEWASELNDWDIYLMRKDATGQYVDTGKSGTNFLTTAEELELPNPPAGDYRLEVVNCSATDTNYTGLISFTPLPPVPPSTYTTAEKDAWMAKLADWVRAGGNLVLTDGALRGLSELTSLSGSAVNKQTVYTGQLTFATASGATETSGANTLSDPLAKNVRQPGARFNTGMRRQTFEPTPLGFAIQDASGGDSAGARQYDVDRAAWEAAGGRTAATSANSGARDAVPVYTRVTLGELKLGSGAIRIAGALLPQPSTEEDHPLGLEPYALTYTGYIVLRNLLELNS